MPSSVTLALTACRAPGDDVVPLVSRTGDYDKVGSKLVEDAQTYEDDAFEALTGGITLDDLQTSARPFTVLAYWVEDSDTDSHFEFAQLAITPNDNRAAIYAAFDDRLSVTVSYNSAVSSMYAYPELPTKACSAYEGSDETGTGEKLGGSVLS